MSPIRRTVALLALASCSSGLFVACGDDDDSASDDTTTTEAEASSTTGTEEAGGAPAALCTSYVDITLALNGEPDPDAIAEDVATVRENAPEEISDALTVMTDAVESVLASGGEDFSAFEAPEFAEAQAEVDPYIFEGCEFDTKLEVEGADYSFEGLPETVEAGRVAILFTNTGTEAHEIGLARKNDGVTETAEEILALPEEEAMSKVQQVGGAFAPSNGAQGLLVADLEAGEYVAVCFIPTGTTAGEDGGFTEGTGEPHFVHGMVQELTVE